jgi:hypothetical protein
MTLDPSYRPASLKISLSASKMGMARGNHQH